ncbi:MAG: hypothetical protein KC996_11290 [Phycisphaerales bacterium]|nr:hypothetical protein [Phycisphaerales bacterium]
MNCSVLMLAIAGGFAGLASADVLYVDGGGNGGDGLSWGTAFSDLQVAIDAAQPGDQLWVRKGLYQPLVPAAGSSDSAYLLVDGVEIYGGFAGNETLLEQRDPTAHLTTLSAAGDPAVLHVLEGNGLGPGTLIDGFTIAGGTGGDTGIGGVGGAGGGMLLSDSSPTVVGCVFTQNSTRIGSGVYVQDGSPEFLDCDFLGNQSVRSGEGGGIYAIITQPGQTQALLVSGCVFNNNSVRQGHWATGNGAGIFAGEGVVLSVLDSDFTSNYGWHNGTFGNAVVGGAIAVLGDDTLIQNCSFITNYSNLGAGIYSAGDIQIVQSLFVANRAVGASTCGGFDCPSDVPDVYSGWGGALFVNSFAIADIVQCTIASNWSADSGGGVVCNGTIRNSVLWDNRSPQPCCGEDPLPLSRMQIEFNASVEYSCVEGLLTPALGEDPPNPNNFPGSNELDPMFVAPTPISSGFGWLTGELGDHHLQSGSPAADAGNNAFLPGGLSGDLSGNPRLIDDPGTVDTGAGGYPIVDMGAFELQEITLCDADLTGDGVLDIFDVFVFLDLFNAGHPDADFNSDGVLDIFDVFAFLDLFNAGCP